jgi:hypothetical protein
LEEQVEQVQLVQQDRQGKWEERELLAHRDQLVQLEQLEGLETQDPLVRLDLKVQQD